MADYDLLGNIAIIKGEGKSKKEKIAQAKELLKVPSIKTVLEKISNVKGRLRVVKVKHVLGKRNLIADYKENNCRFRFNVEKCYFSPRLSNDRKEVALKVKKKDKVLVMFAGVGSYPIVIQKLSKPAKIIGIEIGRECCKWFRENLRSNKMENKVEIIQGDVKKKVDKNLGKFDVVMMARPKLKDSFLEYAFKVSKKGTKIFYHGFCRDEDLDNLIKGIKEESKIFGKRIKVNKILKAGEIAPYKHRWRIEIGVLN